MMNSLFTISAARQVMTDPQRKTLIRIAGEMIYLWYCKSERPGHYFRTLLYRRGVKQLSQFLTSGEKVAIWKFLTSQPDVPLLSNKIMFHNKMVAVDHIKLPRLVGLLHRASFSDSAENVHQLESEGAFRQMILNQAKEFPSGAVFAKPIDGDQGRGAIRVASTDSISVLWKESHRSPYVIQECLTQHPVLASLMPDTLNHLRITTVRTSGEVAIACALLTIGRTGNVAANAGAMLIAPVATETGTLDGIATTKFEHGGRTFPRHPDTGRSFEGITVPFFKEALTMATTAADLFDIPIVGWDIGITPDGPVLIEGNEMPNLVSDEIAMKAGYLGHPLAGPVMDDILSHGPKSVGSESRGNSLPSYSC